MDYTKYNYANSNADSLKIDQGLRSYMLRIYNYMAAGLGITGLLALIAGSSESIMSMMYVMKDGYITGTSPLGWLVTLAPVGIVLLFSFGMAKMSFQNAKMLFWVFAGLMGLSLSSLFLLYTGSSIARVFFITASLFAGMSLYGYTTKKDLTKIGSFLMMGLMGVVLASLVNIFLKSSAIQFATSILTVIIFTGLTAYDTQRLKSMYYGLDHKNEEMIGKVSLMGAFGLYMNFINLFVHLLQFFGDRRDR